MDNSDDSGHSYRGGRGDVGDDNSNGDDEDGDDNDMVYVSDFTFFFSSVILSVIDQILTFRHIPVSDCLQM